MENIESLREAIRLALEGKALLFLGAGAAREGKTKSGNRLPIGFELANRLGDECGIGHNYSLDVVAEHFVETHSETRLINALKKLLTVTSVSDAVETVAELPWMRIWTTNYDNGIELALTSSGKRAISLTTSAGVANARGNRLIVMHINGQLETLKQSITPDFIITTQGYATQAFVDTEWSIVFRNDLQRKRP